MENDQSVDAGAAVGRHQAFAAIAAKCTAAQAAMLRDLKESRACESLGLTWERFCVERLAISRQYADDLIRRLETLGEAYLNLAQFARISPETYHQIAPNVKGDILELSGEQIPLTPENAPRIRAGIHELRRRLRDEERRTRPNIAELHMMSENVLKRARELSVPIQGEIVRKELARMARETAGKWMSLSKSLKQALDEGR